MRFFIAMTMLAMSFVLGACGAEQPSPEPLDVVEVPEPVSADLDYITISDGELRGTFEGRAFDGPATILAGHSSPETSRIEVIIDPVGDDEMAVMALQNFVGDIAAFDEDRVINSRGCAGPAVNRWIFDDDAVNSTAVIEQGDDGVYFVDFSMDFDDGERLEGGYNFVIND